MKHAYSTVLATFVVTATSAAPLGAQMTAANPYRAVDGWGAPPPGRFWGSASAIDPAPDGRTMWLAERCGANSCQETPDIDMIHQLDLDGNVLRSFGAGLILQPHGVDVDAEGNVWVTDTGRAEGKGYQVHKFSPGGELLMSLGTPGGSGDGPDSFNGPSDVQVAPNGDIFVAVGHLGRGDDNRIVKFAADGTFLAQFGSTGPGNDQFWDPHALAMDSQGRLFVGDRYNNRIQILSQDLEYLATYDQFSRPSGLYIDGDDVLYAADSESNMRRHPGWKRGIYIGSAVDGWVTAFIPDTNPDPDDSSTSGGEGVAVDATGSVYAAVVGPTRYTENDAARRAVRKYVRR